MVGEEDWVVEMMKLVMLGKIELLEVNVKTQ